MTSLRKCSICWLLSFLVVGVVKLGGPVLARDPPTKSVKGLVTDQTERPLPEAVVQLKNTRTLQVKSFIADENGSYYFHGLDPNVDYELKAQHEGFSSRAHTLSSFDDRREVIYNLALEIPKQKGHRSLLKKGADATVSGVKTVGTATGKDTTTAAKTTAGAANTAATATADATTKAVGATTQGVTTAADATVSGATAAAGALGALEHKSRRKGRRPLVEPPLTGPGLSPGVLAGFLAERGRNQKDVQRGLFERKRG